MLCKLASHVLQIHGWIATMHRLADVLLQEVIWYYSNVFMITSDYGHEFMCESNLNCYSSIQARNVRPRIHLAPPRHLQQQVVDETSTVLQA